MLPMTVGLARGCLPDNVGFGYMRGFCGCLGAVALDAGCVTLSGCFPAAGCSSATARCHLSVRPLAEEVNA